jgi:acyl carrier protein
MDPEEQVISVLVRRSRLARERVTPEARLVEDLKLDGDDAVERSSGSK